MRHARRDYDCIQPWPTRRPHIARNMVDGQVLHSVPEDADYVVPIIPDDEPVFLIRGQDKVAPSVLRYWADRAEEEGAEKEIIDTVRRWAVEMEKWQLGALTMGVRMGGKVKVPDADKAVLR
jgi:hypothetical protein